MAEKLLTPRGKAIYPYLMTPNTSFDAEGVYKVELDIGQDGEGVKDFIALIDEATVKLKIKPYKVDDDTGNYIIKASSKYKPKVFDSSNGIIPDDVTVGGGSIMRLAVAPVPYDGFGGGLKLYLKAAQVIDLVSYGADDYGFDDVADGYVGEGFPVANKMEDAPADW